MKLVDLDAVLEAFTRAPLGYGQEEMLCAAIRALPVQPTRAGSERIPVLNEAILELRKEAEWRVDNSPRMIALATAELWALINYADPVAVVEGLRDRQERIIQGDKHEKFDFEQWDAAFALRKACDLVLAALRQSQEGTL